MKPLAIPAKLEPPSRADFPIAANYVAALRAFLKPAREKTIYDWLAQLYAYKAAVAPERDQHAPSHRGAAAPRRVRVQRGRDLARRALHPPRDPQAEQRTADAERRGEHERAR